MATIARINQADLLISIRNRVIEQIAECNERNTHFDDDPTEFAQQKPVHGHSVIITPINGGSNSGSTNYTTCDVIEEGHTAIGVYWKSKSQEAQFIDNEMVIGRKSFIRFWKPAIMAAMIVKSGDAIAAWMPQTNSGENMLTEPMKLTQTVNPKRGGGWDLYMQLVFQTSFRWNLS